MKTPKNIVIYQAKTGAIELREDVRTETIWATQAQIADIFDIDRSVATKHIRNILNDKEIRLESNVQKMHIAHSDKPVAFYSLDMILAVGYRSNSVRAMMFRQWATKTLRQHILKAYIPLLKKKPPISFISSSRITHLPMAINDRALLRLCGFLKKLAC